MKKLPIKFRGKRVDTGEYIYGDFVHRGPLESKPGIIDNEDFYNEVDSDSIAQLCGYDRDGNEVYEGDTVYIDKDGYYREYVAHLKGYATNPKDGCYITLDGRFDARLKEESA